MPSLERLKQDLTFRADLAGHGFDFATTWGLFSPRAIDEGTELLARYLEVPSDAVCLDLGCGYGPLGLIMAAKAPSGSVHMVDKDFVAVDYAAKNAERNGLPNTSSYLSNGFSHVPPGITFDVIVSNIPAKIGAELLMILLLESHARLRPGGTLYVVTISGLKDYMKRNLSDVFGNYDKLKQSKTYTAARAVKQ